MHAKKELEILRVALEHWKRPRAPWPGFCLYFQTYHKINIYSDLDFMVQLPKLWDQRPLVGYSPAFWFVAYKCEARIECLMRAIEACEHELEYIPGEGMA